MSILNEPDAHSHAITMLRHRLQLASVCQLTGLSVRRVRDLRDALGVRASQGRRRGIALLLGTPVLRLQVGFVTTCFATLGLTGEAQLLAERGATFAQVLDFYYRLCLWAGVPAAGQLSSDEVFDLLMLHLREPPLRLRCEGCCWRAQVPQSLHGETACPACAARGRWSRLRHGGKKPNS